MSSCREKKWAMSVLCELPLPADVNDADRRILLPSPSWLTSGFPLIACPRQHVTHEMLACDLKSLCWGSVTAHLTQFRLECQAPRKLPPPYFECKAPGEFAPYSLVCDFRDDCTDSSDEAFCVHPACMTNAFFCGNGQVSVSCVSSTVRNVD